MCVAASWKVTCVNFNEVSFIIYHVLPNILYIVNSYFSSTPYFFLMYSMWSTMWGTTKNTRSSLFFSHIFLCLFLYSFFWQIVIPFKNRDKIALEPFKEWYFLLLFNTHMRTGLGIISHFLCVNIGYSNFFTIFLWHWSFMNIEVLYFLWISHLEKFTTFFSPQIFYEMTKITTVIPWPKLNWIMSDFKQLQIR